MANQTMNVEDYIAKHLRDTELFEKVRDMMQYVVENTNTEIADVKNKYTHTESLSEEAIRQIMLEQGYDYIVGLMDTITGFEFNTMLSFIDLIDQLKGTRQGLELVLKLLGFDSIIEEWWEALTAEEPWTYAIIVIVNSSLVPDIFKTIEQVKIFSNNYVLAQISNIDVRFSADKFAERGAIMGGFELPKYSGTIIVRALP